MKKVMSIVTMLSMVFVLGKISQYGRVYIKPDLSLTLNEHEAWKFDTIQDIYQAQLASDFDILTYNPAPSVIVGFQP